MKCPIPALSTLLLMLLGSISPALAFQFNPMSQVFAPTGADATRAYEVVNDQNRRIAVEVTVVERHMDVNGDETYVPAEDDFLIYPAQMILEPGAIQVVRVSWLGNPAPDQELAYRLIAEQLPIPLGEVDPSDTREPVGQIQVLMRYIGSLFVRPAGVQAAVQLASVTSVTNASEAAVAVTLSNTGQASAQLDDLSLTLTAAGQSVTLTAEQLPGVAGTTILPGQSRRYELPWPADLPRAPVTATFEYRQD